MISDFSDRIYHLSGRQKRVLSELLWVKRSCIVSDFVVLVLSEAVLSATVLVLDGCSNCSDADRRSRRFAGTCGPIGRIAIRDLFRYE
jgi:hypothetical protein